MNSLPYTSSPPGGPVVTETPWFGAFMSSESTMRMWCDEPVDVPHVTRIMSYATFFASRTKPWMITYETAADAKVNTRSAPIAGRILTRSPGWAAIVTGASHDVPPG